MRIAEYFYADDVTQRRLFKQVGVDHAVLRLPEADDGSTAVDLHRLARLQQEFAADGLTIEVIEPLAPPFEQVKQGLPGRDQQLEQVNHLLRGMGELGIGILCYNFMAVHGWMRTRFDLTTRGGALVTGFDRADLPDADAAVRLDDDQLWDNYRYFLHAVVPVAEEAGVRLALHPDDTPLSPLRGVARILRTPDALERALSLSDSPNHGITFCQGTIATMGADVPATIRRLGRRTFFVHFRDIAGTAESFVETFISEGRTDMWAAMRAWVEVGFEGPVRSDHVPTLHGEPNHRPGYATLGRLHAIGNIQGLYEAARAEASAHT
ncbi:MAG: mannonate dehydratase [Jiangellaceae bacterium]